MSQLLYIVLALFLVMVVALNAQRGVAHTARGQALNEVTTQLTGVATDVLERIGQTHFDRHTFDRFDPADPELHKPYCGRVENGQESTAFAAPGAFVACADFDTCGYIEGFHGLADFTRTRGGFEFTVDSVRVEYVDPEDFAVTPGVQTFAKRVTVVVNNPHFYLGDDPANTLDLEMERVFTYGCTTDPNFIPYLRPAPQDPGCPLNPCALRY